MAHVLVVDDEAAIAEAIARAAGLRGHTVTIAANGQRAWDEFCARVPDLVITDVSMANGDGLELARRVRGCETPRPVLLVSGNPISAEDTALSAATLRKPVPIPKMLATIEAVLGSRQGESSD